MREAAIGAAGQAFGSDQFSSPWGLAEGTRSGGNYRRKLLEHVLKGRDFRVLRRMSGDENYTRHWDGRRVSWKLSKGNMKSRCLKRA